MSTFLIVLIILASLLFITIIATVIIAVDWRAFFLRRYGEDYTKGLAHINLNGKWLYRNSELIYESDLACTYARMDGKAGVIYDDIVPNAIGYDYDEYTGRRVYRAIPGAAVCTSDCGDAPAVNIPAALISTDTLGKVSVLIATSVQGMNKPFNWKPFIIVGLLIIALVGAGFASGIIKLPYPATAPVQTAPASTANQTNIELHQIK